LPPLNDAQKRKLRQLSLLSLARDSKHATESNLTSPVLGYSSLLVALGLSTPRELEDLVISTIYAGLIQAQLDPKHELVRISSVAPLRDVAPGQAATPNGTDVGSAIGGLLSSLQTWAGRCEATLQHLEEQMSELRADADRRAAAAASWSQRMETLVEEEHKGGGIPRNAKRDLLTLNAAKSRLASASGGGSGSGASATQAAVSDSRLNAMRLGNKRGSGQMDASGSSDVDDEAMDVDDDDPDNTDAKKRGNKRKL